MYAARNMRSAALGLLRGGSPRSRTRAIASLALPLIVTISSAGCGPGVAPHPPPKTAAQKTPEKSAPPPESPARWAFHATKLTGLRARLDLQNGALYGGDGGERWFDKRDGSPPTPASTLVPEGIAAIVRGADDKSFVFVGVSGTTYLASEPLSAIASKKSPATTLRSPAAGKKTIVAISDTGLVRSSDGGATWSKVDLPSPGGSLVATVMNDAGLGLVLAAPQRVWATQDDGVTWAQVATPGVGARRAVLDVNGDVMIEGIDASAILKGTPLRLERVARAPKSDGWDLAAGPTTAVLGYAKALTAGRGAFVGDRWLEAVAEPDDPTRWRLAFGKLGERIEPKKIADLNGCDRVWVAGDARSIFVACDDRGGAKKVPTTFGTGPKPPKSSGGERATIRILRSDDEGKTWTEEATAGSKRLDVGHLWVTPDRALILDGGCKKPKADCYEGPPIIRVPQSKTFAKLGLPSRVQGIAALAFSPNGTRAYALGKSDSGPLVLLVSKNGGRDYGRVALPTVPAPDGNQPALNALHAEARSVSVDASGAVVATVRISGEWIVYTSEDEGATIKGRRFPHRADGVAFAGKRGFAWARHGKAWETTDAGATWTTTGAPSMPELGSPDAQVVCSDYGCHIGDRATRVGWGGGGGGAGSDPASAAVASATPLTCATDGEWKPLGPVLAAPSAYEAELSAGARWLAIKHDHAKGSVSVVLGKTGAKGIETKEVSLFGPSGKDVATAVLPQIEGAAAIRFAFKRDPGAKPDPKDKDAKDKKPSISGGVTDGQKVDVDVAWYVAATGAVHHARIHGAGPLDPRDVVGTGKDSAAMANLSLLSIAQGGVHVRPFATKPDVPLWFVREGGKVDRLPWPDLPTKDIAGAPITPRLDAVRAAGRSVILGVIGSQLFMSWANEGGTSWESRTWGLWPDVRNVEPSWDFTYGPGTGTALRPTVVVQWPGGAGIAPSAWGVPLKGVESDPSEAIPMATQTSLADPPSACSGDSGTRVVAPFSSGTRHPLTVKGEGADVLLATTYAVVRGDAKTACVAAYEARPISTKSKAVKTDENAYSAVIPWADKDHAYLFRTASNGDASVKTMKCAPSKEVPAGLAGVEGFGDAK